MLNRAGRKKSMMGDTEKFYQDQLVTTLRKKPENRAKLEIEILYQLATTKFKLSPNGEKSFFQNFLEENGDQNLKELLKYCYYEFVPKDNLVFEYDSPGTEFYIILEGQVEFYTKGQKDAEHKSRLEALNKEKEIPVINSGPKNRSTFEGVPRLRPCNRSVVKKTASGLHVVFDGRKGLYFFRYCDG